VFYCVVSAKELELDEQNIEVCAFGILALASEIATLYWHCVYDQHHLGLFLCCKYMYGSLWLNGDQSRH